MKQMIISLLKLEQWNNGVVKAGIQTDGKWVVLAGDDNTLQVCRLQFFRVLHRHLMYNTPAGFIPACKGLQSSPTTSPIADRAHFRPDALWSYIRYFNIKGG
jgi:hypothetical protein